MDTALIIATLLGGLAAVVYFWEKLIPKGLLRKFERAPAIPMTSASLYAYASAHHRPLGLTKEIAERRGFQIESIDSESAWLNEQIKALGIKTVRELDQLVKRHAAIARRLSDYMTPETRRIDSGFVLGRVIEVAAIERGGKEGLRTFFASLKYSSGSPAVADETFETYQQIKRHG